MGLQLALLATLVVVLAVRLLPLVRHLWRLHRLSSPIPGPRVYPVFGSTLGVLTKLDNINTVAFDLIARYGRTIKLWISHFICVVVVTDPVDLAVVFNSPLLANKIPLMYDAIKPMLGTGLININGPEYRRHRKAISSSLHAEILKDFHTTFQKSAAGLVRRLAPHAETGDVFRVDRYMADCANLNVCETVFSADVISTDAARASYTENALKSSRVMFRRVMRPWYHSDAVFKHLDPSLYREYYAVAKGMTDLTAEILTLKIKQSKSGEVPTTARKHKTFLDHFLQSEESSLLDFDEVLGELKVLMFGASDTTRGLMSFFMAAMSEYPEIQKKIHEELDDVLGEDTDRVVEWNDLPHLQYLECVLKEVLRLYPPVPLIGRQATGDVTLPSGYTIPKGAYVGICAQLTQRIPEHFPDPLRFNPDRFLPESSTGRHPYAYIPFSAGIRSCIGQRYGMVFVKTVFGTLLRRYTVLRDPNSTRLLSDPTTFSVGITAEVRGGVKVRLQRRTPKQTRVVNPSENGVRAE